VGVLIVDEDLLVLEVVDGLIADIVHRVRVVQRVGRGLLPEREKELKLVRIIQKLCTYVLSPLLGDVMVSESIGIEAGGPGVGYSTRDMQLPGSNEQDVQHYKNLHTSRELQLLKGNRCQKSSSDRLQN
jgi:hypothetical protein